MEEADWLIQPTLTVCLDEIVELVDRGEREEERNEDLKALLEMFPKRSFDKLTDLVEKRLQNEYFSPSPDLFKCLCWEAGL